MTMKDLLEKRSRLVADMRSITASPEGEGGDLSADQATRFDGLKTELEGVEARIARQQTIDDAERRMAGQQIAGGGDDRFDAEVREFSLTRAIAGAAGMGVDDGREREIGQELRRRSGQAFQGIPVPMAVFEERVITTAAPSGAVGGNLIAVDHMGSQYIDRLRAALVIRRLGARVLNGLQGDVDIPALKDSAVAGWVAENSALTPSDQGFRKVQLRPKHAGALTEFSRNMLLQSSPDIEQIVRSDFAAVLAEAVDRAAIHGGGTNGPDGLLEHTDLNTTVDMSAGATWEKVLELIEAVQVADSEGSAFITDPTVVRVLRSTPRVADTDSRMIMEGRAQLADYPVAATTIATVAGDPNEHPLIFGRWSDMMIGFWSSFDLLVNPYAETAYSKGNVQVRGMLTMDVNVRHIESFAAAEDVSTGGGE